MDGGDFRKDGEILKRTVGILKKETEGIWKIEKTTENNSSNFINVSIA